MKPSCGCKCRDDLFLARVDLDRARRRIRLLEIANRKSLIANSNLLTDLVASRRGPESFATIAN